MGTLLEKNIYIQPILFSNNLFFLFRVNLPPPFPSWKEYFFGDLFENEHRVPNITTQNKWYLVIRRLFWLKKTLYVK